MTAQPDKRRVDKPDVDPHAPLRFTLTELAREAEREVVLRQNVYPTRIAAGKMRPEQAERQIAMMREIGRRLQLEDDGQAAQRLW